MDGFDKYSLRIYDTELLSFHMGVNTFGEPVVDILDVNEDKKYLLPLEMSCDNKGLLQWLNARIIPKNRMFVEAFL